MTLYGRYGNILKDGAHNNPSRRYLTIKERLEEKKLIIEGDHWIWTGSLNKDGYGQITIKGVNLLVHRVAYKEYKNEELGEVLMVLHKPPCNIRNCFNPEHLYSGNNSDNAYDAIEMKTWFNSTKTHCLKGHLYDEFNTKINSEGHRFCRECARILSYKRGRKK